VNICELDSIFIENIENAKKGMEYWHKLKNELTLGDNECVLLFPSINREINYTCLLYLNQLLKHRHYENAVILCIDKSIIKNAKRFSSNIRKVVEISRDDAICLMKYYSLFEFSNRFFICSLDEPEGRMGELLLEKWKFPMHEMVCVGIYRIYDYAPEVGNIKNFL
jgi:hypothetical protein